MYKLALLFIVAALGLNILTANVDGWDTYYTLLAVGHSLTIILLLVTIRIDRKKKKNR
jgi:sugar phosphate permease